MKKTIGAAVLALAVAGTAALVSAQGRNNVFVYGGNWSDLITLDPGQSYEFSGGLITDNMYQTLVKFEGEDISTLKPSAAINWGVKDAGDSWKVKFKLGLSKFSSGRRLTAADVVYTFDRAIALKGNGSFLFTDVANIKVGSTKALDLSTVEITLPKTASPAAFLNVLTSSLSTIPPMLKVRTFRNAAGEAVLGMVISTVLESSALVEPTLMLATSVNRNEPLPLRAIARSKV